MTTKHSNISRKYFIAALISSFILLSAPAAAATFAQTRAPKRNPRRALLAKPQRIKAEEGIEAAGLKTYALRLRPGQDLRIELEKFTRRTNLRAGFILTAVGSLRKASLRLADQKNPTSLEDKFEIVSLVGTLSPDGPHLHLSLSDASGRTIGGHLLEGSIIYTTAEIIIGELKGLRFNREQDAETGYQELRIRPR
jgi:predicted DNA-binding protein with PD1-like motif